MNLIDYLVLGGLAIIIVCIIIWLARRKKKCDGGCGCCPHKCKQST